MSAVAGGRAGPDDVSLKGLDFSRQWKHKGLEGAPEREYGLRH